MFVFLGLGLAVGIISGMLGIGGGILLIPSLMWLGGLEGDDAQFRAAGITLAVLAMPVVLPAVWQYYKQGYIKPHDFGSAGWIAVGFATGGLLGSLIVPHISVPNLRFLFGLTLVFIAVRYLLISDKPVMAAFYGLIVTGVSWVLYLGLRLLARRHLPPPDLGQTIRAIHEQQMNSGDYMI